MWAAPVDIEDKQTAALGTARVLGRRLADEVQGLQAGIGVSCGTAVAGNVGTPDCASTRSSVTRSTRPPGTPATPRTSRHASSHTGRRGAGPQMVAARTQSTSGRCSATGSQVSPSSGLAKTLPSRLPKYTPAGSPSSTHMASRMTPVKKWSGSPFA